LDLWSNPIVSIDKNIKNLGNLTKFQCSRIQNPDNIITFNGNTRCFLKINGYVICGCEKYTIEEFIVAVEKKYGSMQNYCPQFKY